MMFLLNSNKYLLVPHNDKDLIRIEGDLGFTEKVVECKRIE